jgi:Zn-dependent protease/predicted transcriptional regulator
MFGNSWRLGRLAGVEIRVDTSWVVIALLVAYSLYLQFSETFRGLAPGLAVALAIGSALLFFGSVLAHEMAHALVAKRRGIPVRGITLFLFGGATHAKVESKGPKDELLISVVGPVTSLVLGGLLLAIGSFGRELLPNPVGGAFRYLGFVNVVLAVFNILPGFPLDGGRVLRSIVWKVTGSLARATRVASISGQAVGYLMVAGGALLVFAERLVSGIWFAAIGWFLTQAARSSYDELQVRRLLEQVEAEDVMADNLITVPADISVADAVDRYFMRRDHSAFPVVDGDHTVGLLTLRGVKRLPREEWESRRVRDAMGGLGDQLNVSPDARMDHVMAKLQEGDAGRVLVVRDGQVIGIITAGDVARWLQRWRTLRSTR